MLRLALAQVNPTVGDLAGNAAKILDFARRADAAGAALAVFPELVLTGYPPEDLLLSPAFVRDAETALLRLARDLPPRLTAVIGCLDGRPGRLHNAAAVARGGRVRARYRKRLLPNYGVFDEARYFTPGRGPLVVPVAGLKVGVTICEDIWFPKGPAVEAARRGAGLIINLSASPYHAGKIKERLAAAAKKARECRVPLAYCNLVGGQDELVFDGGSFLVDGRGRLAALAPLFEESLLEAALPPARRPRAPRATAPEEEVYSALVLGTRDYMRKNGFKKALVGLSGGIDSALVACVAADAVGAENAVGVTLPSRFNAPETRADARRLAESLGMPFHAFPIEGVVQEFTRTLAPLFDGLPPGLAEENLQSRARGTLLMALSNKFGWLVLTTGNKSETSVGYCTLYGDTAGGFAVLKDISKTWVYRLSRWRNAKAGRELIPQSTIDRAPTAELRENQKDQDTLPPYDLLDRIISLYVEEKKGLPEIARSGAAPAVARRVLRMIDASEYKRRQAPPGIKITPLAFGRDRRMPVTNAYRV